MEAPSGDPGPRNWASWDPDSFEASVFPNLEYNGTTEPEAPFALPEGSVDLERLSPEHTLHLLGIDLSENDPLDYCLDNSEPGPPGFEPSPLSTGAISPGSQIGSVWSLSSGDSDFSFTSPSAGSDTPCLTPGSFVSAGGPLHGGHIDIPDALAARADNVTHPGGEPIAAPGAQASLTRPRTTSHQNQERPPGMSAYVVVPADAPRPSSFRRKRKYRHANRATSHSREWNKIIRPARCGICGKGHAYKADLNRHIVRNHREHAAALGLSTERPVCKWCSRSFARKDHLLKHQTRKHGRVPIRRR